MKSILPSHDVVARRRCSFATVLGVAVTISAAVYGAQTDFNPNRSLFVTVTVGSALSLQEEDRSALNLEGERVNAYSLASFQIGVSAGYRFNEIFGLDGGWHEAQHRVPSKWGNSARYSVGHLVFRASLPLATRQTPLFKIGLAVGRFSYGTASIGQAEENATFIVGPMAGLSLEHELMLGLVTTVEVTYLPLFRQGMDGVMKLEEVSYDTSGTTSTRTIDSRDLTDDTFVHTLWLALGIQLEWTIR